MNDATQRGGQATHLCCERRFPKTWMMRRVERCPMAIGHSSSRKNDARQPTGCVSDGTGARRPPGAPAEERRASPAPHPVDSVAPLRLPPARLATDFNIEICRPQAQQARGSWLRLSGLCSRLVP
jgi:hypothetical protein